MAQEFADEMDGTALDLVDNGEPQAVVAVVQFSSIIYSNIEIIMKLINIQQWCAERALPTFFSGRHSACSVRVASSVARAQ